MSLKKGRLVGFLTIVLMAHICPSTAFPQTLSPTISDKGRKLAEAQQTQKYVKPVKTEATAAATTTTTEDPFAFGNDIDSGSIDDGWGETKEDDGWGDFDSGSVMDELLPPCSSVESPDIPCTNATVEPPEIRYRDPVMSRLVSQVWSDFQLKLNSEARLYGVDIDPFDVDSRLPEPIDLQQSGNMFNVDVKMKDIKVYGLSGIRLDESSVTRSENLTDMKIKVVFAFDQLIVNGTYDLKGQFGWWALDSVGEQLFAISMVNATLTYGMKLEVISDTGDWSTLRCSASSPDNVLITEIRLPLEYADVNFKFDNLGAFANTVVNAVGIYFLKTQEEMLVGEIRKQIKKSVNSLIC